MDVSIAVSLLRGQMGAVVERAVSGAVETVLSEMLRAVGVKFEELKTELLRAKREAALLQREKLQREKESDAVRAKLRYAELKLKYYRQGVEEELQHRAALAHSQMTGALRTPPAPQCTSSHQGEGELTVSDWEGSDQHSGQTLCDWTIEPVQVPDPHSEEDSTNQVGSSTLPPAARQVKQEVPWAQGEELMCVKEEPQEVTLHPPPPAEEPPAKRRPPPASAIPPRSSHAICEPEQSGQVIDCNLWEGFKPSASRRTRNSPSLPEHNYTPTPPDPERTEDS